MRHAPDLETELLDQALDGEVASRDRDYARCMQAALNRVVGTRLAVDSVTGPATRAAVRAFQQRRGLVVDGIVGPRTEAALIAAAASRPPASSDAPTAPGAAPVPRGAGASPRLAALPHRSCRPAPPRSGSCRSARAGSTAWSPA
jgi:hypothetical protein